MKTFMGDIWAKIRHQVFLDERTRSKIHPSEIDRDTWQRCTRAFCDQDLVAEVSKRRTRLTSRAEREAFLQKYPFASPGAIRQDFLTTVPTVKEIFQRDLGMQKISRR
jgi:hypothetical protein